MKIQTIKEVREAEEERACLAAAMQQVPEGILITDAAGCIRYVNPSFEKITGCARDEIIGRNLQALQHDSPDAQFYKVMWDTVCRGGEWSGRFTNRKQNGHLYEEEATITPIRAKSGEIVNYVAVKREITHEVQMEKQLHQAQKMEAIGTLAGGIAHDFNNILAAIIGYVELAQFDIPERHPAHQKLEKVLAAGHRAKDLVKQILAFSRQSDFEKRPIRLDPIITEALKFIRASLPATIEIRQQLKTDTGLIMADSTQIHQLIMNLCSNAAQAMEASGGTLDIRTETVEIAPEHVNEYPDLIPGSYVKLTVADTGHGMTPDTLERIFEPFFTTKEKGKGTGMGLAVVHGIIKGHRGAIKAVSQPAKGTIFTVWLPETEHHFHADQHLPGPLPMGREEILFIDDEESQVELGKQILGRLGYQVVVTSSPLEALEIFRGRRKPFDLVITNMTMPRMTGIALAKKFNEIQPDIPIILTTGFSGQIDEEKASQVGIRAILMKPLAISELAETVRHALDDRRSAGGCQGCGNSACCK